MKEIRVTNPIAEDIEPVAIVIEGTRTSPDGAPEKRVEVEERFVCKGHQPFAAAELIMRARVPIGEYIRLCLEQDQEARWDALMRDKDFDVQTEAVRSVYYGLVEHYSGDRPTQGSGASGAGPESTDDSSTDDGPSEGSTSEQ